MPGAASYRVWRKSAGDAAYRQLATVAVGGGAESESQSQVRRWRDGATRSGAVYLYRVQACPATGACGGLSWRVSAVTSGSKRLANASRINLAVQPGRTVGMSMGEQTELLRPRGRGFAPAPAPAEASARARAHGRQVVSARLRFFSTNPAVATVSLHGGIVYAHRLGKAAIRVVAHNGRTRSVHIVVRDYAHPAQFNYAVIGQPVVRKWFQAHSAQAGDLVDYLLTHPGLRYVKTWEVSIYLDDAGEVVSNIALPPDLKTKVESMLIDSDYPVTIYGGDTGAEFLLNDISLHIPSAYVYYSANVKYKKDYSPAPRWAWDNNYYLY